MKTEDMEKILNETNQVDTTQVVVDAVDADQLPRETALKYEELCQLVGSLVIDSHHKMKGVQEQFVSIKSQWEAQARELYQENQRLKAQLGESRTEETP